jgi:hypothetical protein
MHEFTESRIASVDQFISEALKGLAEKSPADDLDNNNLLYETMTFIRDVKLASNAMKELLSPSTSSAPC